MLVDVLPAQVSFAGGLYSSAGAASWDGNVIRWQGDITPQATTTIRYQVNVGEEIVSFTPIANTAVVEDGQGQSWHLPAVIIANGRLLFLPIALAP